MQVEEIMECVVKMNLHVAVLQILFLTRGMTELVYMHM